MNKKIRRENTVDGRVAHPNGNHEAVMEICAMAAEQYRGLAIKTGMGLDDVGEYLVAALKDVAAGVRPDIAFQWRNAEGRSGRPKGNNALRDWDVCMEVKDRLLKGQTWLNACQLMAEENGGDYFLSSKNIQTIAKGIHVDSHLPLPDDIFPLPKHPYKKNQIQQDK